MKYGSYQLHPFVAQVMGAHKSTVEKAKEPEVECSDTKNYFHSLSLPPYPREVHVHMMKEACSLKKETIQLSSHIKFPNFPKYREFLVHEPVAMKEIHGQIPLVLCLVSPCIITKLIYFLYFSMVQMKQLLIQNY